MVLSGGLISITCMCLPSFKLLALDWIKHGFWLVMTGLIAIDCLHLASVHQEQLRFRATNAQETTVLHVFPLRLGQLILRQVRIGEFDGLDPLTGIITVSQLVETDRLADAETAALNTRQITHNSRYA